MRIALIFAVLPTVAWAQPSLKSFFTRDEASGCFTADPESIRQLALGGALGVAAKLDPAIAAQIEETADKPYQRDALKKKLDADPEWKKTLKALSTEAAAATFCGALEDQTLTFTSGAFRFAMTGQGGEKLTQAIIAPAPEGQDGALSVGAYKRVECWKDDAKNSLCGPVFKDLPKPVKDVVENGGIKLRWMWKGLPKPKKAKKPATTVLSIDKPWLELYAADGKALWAADGPMPKDQSAGSNEKPTSDLGAVALGLLELDNTDVDAETVQKKFNETALQRVDDCYELELAKAGSFKGKLSVRATVTPKGTLTALKVDENSTGNAALAACVLRKLDGVTVSEPQKALWHVVFPLGLSSR